MSIAIGRHLRSNVVGYVALFVAMTSPAWAAEVLPRNSVGTEQIRNRQVKGADVGANQIRSPHLARGTIRNHDIANLKRFTLDPRGAIKWGSTGLRLTSLFDGQLIMEGEFVVHGTLSTGPEPGSVQLTPDGNVSIRGGSNGAGRIDFWSSKATGMPNRWTGVSVYSRQDSENRAELVADFGGGYIVPLASDPSP